MTGPLALGASLTPMPIAAGEIAVIGVVVVDGWASWPWISAGGGVVLLCRGEVLREWDSNG